MRYQDSWKLPRFLRQQLRDLLATLNQPIQEVWSASENQEKIGFEFGTFVNQSGDCFPMFIIALYIIDSETWGDAKHHLTNAFFSMTGDFDNEKAFWDELGARLHSQAGPLLHLIKAYVRAIETRGPTPSA